MCLPYIYEKYTKVLLFSSAHQTLSTFPESFLPFLTIYTLEKYSINGNVFRYYNFRLASRNFIANNIGAEILVQPVFGVSGKEKDPVCISGVNAKRQWPIDCTNNRCSRKTNQNTSIFRANFNVKHFLTSFNCLIVKTIFTFLDSRNIIIEH